MKKIILNIVLAALCLNFAAQAQDKKPNITALKIGDKVPDITISNILNYKDVAGKPATSAKISDFKGKLLILDFWDTWCGSCIEALPKLDSLQEIFKDSICILPVTIQNEKAVKKFIAQNAYLKGFDLPSIVDDKLLSKLFPHSLLPHDVWIDKNGKVCAVTDVQYINYANISSILNGDNPHWIFKKDNFQFNESQPILTANSTLIGSKPVFYSAIAPYISGVPAAFGVYRDSVRNTIRTYAFNIPIIKLYMMSLERLLYFPPNQIFLEVKNKSDYLYNDSTYRNDWDSKHCFTYESVLPLNTSNSKRLHILQDAVNQYFELNGRMEKRHLKSLVLSLKDGNTALFRTKGGKPENTLHSQNAEKRLSNAKLSNLLWEMNECLNNPPVLDETHFNGKVDMILPVSNFTNITQIRKALDQYGILLTEAERDVNVFVLTELHSH